MVWHTFPWKVNDPSSWEGHVSGGISGLILSLIYRNSGPQHPEKVWEVDDEDGPEMEYFESEEEEQRLKSEKEMELH